MLTNFTTIRLQLCESVTIIWYMFILLWIKPILIQRNVKEIVEALSAHALVGLIHCPVDR